MSETSKPFSRRGGARAGFVNYSWPLATLTADAAGLTLTTSMFGLFETGRYHFTPAQVSALERTTRGLRIRHSVADYPEKILFWCRPDATLQGIAEAGFIAAGEPALHQSGTPSRGFPFRVAPVIVAFLVWNSLLGLVFFAGNGFKGFPGPLSFAAVALLFLTSLAALRLPAFQAVLLRPGRSIGEVRPLFLLLATVSGLMTLGFGFLLLLRIP